MSYDTGDFTQGIEQYQTFDATFGATTVTHVVRGPKGKTGWVRDIQCDVLVTLVGTTTVPEVTVGASSGAVEYGRFRLGTSATAGYTAGTVARASQLAVSGTGGIPRVLSDFSGHVALETARIPADTDFHITGKAGVGGTPAGGGVVRVKIQWL